MNKFKQTSIVALSAVVIGLIGLSGCVSNYALLEKPDTKEQKYCSNKGWGWIGAPMAISDHNECLDQFQKQGFIKVSDQSPTDTDVPVSPTTITGKDGSFKITVPAGWVQATNPTPNTLVQLYVKNPSKDTHLQISTSDSVDIDVDTYVGARRDKMLNKLTQATSTEIQKIKVNNLDAFRLEVKGILSDGVKIHYLFTLIKTNNKLVHLVVWSAESKFDENRSEFEQLASAMQF